MMDQGYEMNKAVGYLSAAAVIGIVGSYLWGWLDQKFSVRSASIVYCIWYIIAIILLLTGGKSTTFLAVFFVGIALGGIGNLAPSMVAYTFGRSEFASVNRVIAVIMAIVMPLAFAIMGISYEKTQSYDAAYKVLIGIAIVSAILIFFTRKNYNPDLDIIES
jgi:MFS family permease